MNVSDILDEEPTAETPRVDLPYLAGSLSNTLSAELKNLLSDARDDVELYAKAISQSLATAAAVGNSSLTTELKGQLEILADIYNIEVTASKFRVVHALAGTAVGALSAALGALIPEGGQA